MSDPQHIYLVMDYCDAGDLSTLLHGQGGAAAAVALPSPPFPPVADGVPPYRRRYLLLVCMHGLN